MTRTDPDLIRVVVADDQAIVRDGLVTDHDLRDARRVTQVDEGHATVIPAPVDPAREGDGLTDVVGSERAGRMGAEHGDVLSRTAVWASRV